MSHCSELGFEEIHYEIVGRRRGRALPQCGPLLGKSMSGAMRLFLSVSLPLYVLDQVTKFWVVFNFRPPEIEVVDGERLLRAPLDSRPVIEGFFHLTRIHNTGVAFGFGNGTAWAPVVFLLVPLIALSLIVWYWKKGGFSGLLGKASASLLVAGICGNVTDRLLQGFFLEKYAEASFWERLSQGYVVDFLDFYFAWFNYHYPAFNVADSCICVAAVCFFFHGLRKETGGGGKSEAGPDLAQVDAA